MSRFLVLVLLTAMTALGTEVTTPTGPSNQTTLATFNKDVLPVLQKNCQTCHRSGGVAPMSFTSYESTRPWAKAIKAAVINKKMPPWFADPHVGEFRNAPQLTQADINTLAAWADNGAAEGNAADKPKPVEFIDGWRIQPDVVVSMPNPYRVAPRGAGEVRQFVIPNPFKEDTWVSAIEIRPGDASVVHHVILQVPEQGGLAGAFGQVVFQKAAVPNVTVCADCPDEAAAEKVFALQADRVAVVQRQVQALEQAVEVQARVAALTVAQNGPGGGIGLRGGGQGGTYSDVLVKLRERETGRGAFTTMEAVYAPGTQPLDFRYDDSAKLIPGGKPLRIEVHYTPNGKATTDQTRVAFTLAKAPAQRRFVMMAPEHLVDPRKPIPAGEANWETKGELTFTQDVELVWFMPHMHLRGKDMTFQLIYPDGRKQDVLSANFNFNWQLGYELKNPIKVPKNTKMVVTAHHDNSANNAMNPTPGNAAAWGEMTSQEMMLPWFGVIVDRAVTPDMIALYVPPDLDAPMPGARFVVHQPDVLHAAPPQPAIPPQPAVPQRAVGRRGN
jgi:hypothetical protein